MMLRGYPKRCEDNVWRDIGDEVVILDEGGTQVCLLNKTASLIWTLADGTRTMEEIAGGLYQRFEVSRQEALADVQEFGAQLLEAGLIEFCDQSPVAVGE
jgi:hypothetical protein